MSWHWSRLLPLAFVVLLYASPFSSGDKGLWLSFASMPVQLFGTSRDSVPPEHSILLPGRVGLALSVDRVERSEPALASGMLAVNDTIAHARSEQGHYPSSWSAFQRIYPAPSASRGPPC